MLQKVTLVFVLVVSTISFASENENIRVPDEKVLRTMFNGKGLYALTSYGNSFLGSIAHKNLTSESYDTWFSWALTYTIQWKKMPSWQPTSAIYDEADALKIILGFKERES